MINRNSNGRWFFLIAAVMVLTALVVSVVVFSAKKQEHKHGLATLDLKFKESRRTDQYGNEFRYRAKVKDVHDEQVGRWAWDVFLVSSP